MGSVEQTKLMHTDSSGQASGVGRGFAAVVELNLDARWFFGTVDWDLHVSHMTHLSLLRGRRVLFFCYFSGCEGMDLRPLLPTPHSSPQNCAHGRQGSAGPGRCERNVQKMTGRGPTLFVL